MAIQTVCGPIDKNDVGFTLMHEHIYSDAWTPYAAKYMDKNSGLDDTCMLPLTMEKLGLVRREPRAIAENLILTDMDIITNEIGLYKQAGGSLIMDATPSGHTQSPANLQKISQETGVHIVSSTGYFMSSTLSEQVKKMSASEMATASIQEITEGYAGLDIKAGFIGEIGAVGEMDDIEKKVLEAAAIAQKETGASVTLHTACPNTFFASKYKRTWGERVHLVLDYMQSHGADLSRVIVGHADVSVDTAIDDRLRVLERGVVLEYDNFGQEHPYDIENTYALTDWQRMEHIIEFISHGYGAQLLLASDVWQRVQYIAYGGWGYAHVLQNICPMLLRNGVSPAQIEQLTILTPRRLLDK